MNALTNKSTIISAVIALIIGTGIGFAGGITYQQNQTRNRFSQFGGPNGDRIAGQGNQTGMRANGMRPVSGDIVSVDTTGITVKTADGSSKIIVIPESASINRAALGSKTDLTVGERVSIFGTTNSDGTVTAQNIQLNPTQPK